MLERQALALLLQSFAYDARATAARILELHGHGAEAEALREQGALLGRILCDWFYKQVALPHPHPSLFDLASPLRLGLGPELERWLMCEELLVSEIKTWLEQHGPGIDRFVVARYR
jgi:hypothetical protein